MMIETCLDTIDAIGNARLDLEAVKTVFDLFCASFGLLGSETDVVMAAKCNALQMIRAADALLMLLCNTVDKLKNAEAIANEAHHMVQEQEPTPPEKAVAIQYVLHHLNLAEKRGLCQILQSMISE